jgi:hypothetical protein
MSRLSGLRAIVNMLVRQRIISIPFTDTSKSMAYLTLAKDWTVVLDRGRIHCKPTVSIINVFS